MLRGWAHRGGLWGSREVWPLRPGLWVGTASTGLVLGLGGREGQRGRWPQVLALLDTAPSVLHCYLVASPGWATPNAAAPRQCQLGQPGQLGLVPGTPAVRKPRASHPDMSWCCHPPRITGSAELRAAVSGRSSGGNGAGAPLGAPSWGQQGLAPPPGAHIPALLRRG